MFGGATFGGSHFGGLLLAAAGGGSLTLNVSDSISFGEGLASAPSKPLSDAISFSDALARSVGIAKADAVAFGDTFSGVASFVRTFTDSITLGEAFSTSGIGGYSWNLSLLLPPQNSTSTIVFPSTASAVVIPKTRSTNFRAY